MAGRILLDTSFIIDLFASRPEIRKRIAAADEVFVPAIARQHALTVATLDAHFQEIEGIELISG